METAVGDRNCCYGWKLSSPIRRLCRAWAVESRVALCGARRALDACFVCFVCFAGSGVRVFWRAAVARNTAGCDLGVRRQLVRIANVFLNCNGQALLFVGYRVGKHGVATAQCGRLLLTAASASLDGG